MQINRSITAYVTLFAFMFNGVPIAQADVASAASSAATIPNYVAQGLLGLPGTQSGLNSTINACDVQFPVENASTFTGSLMSLGQKGANALANKSKTKEAPLTGDCYHNKSWQTSEAKSGAAKAANPNMGQLLSGASAKKTKANKPSSAACDLTCPAPNRLLDGGSCSKYFKDTIVKGHVAEMPAGSTVSTVPYIPRGIVHEWKDGGEKMLQDDKDEVSTYKEFLYFKTQNCGNQKLAEVQAQMDNYACKTAALKNAVSQAATQLQTALAANTKSFTSMIQFQSQVGEQMTQIDEILGPDPSDPNKGTSNSQFGGLLGVQAALNKELPNWTAQDASYKTSVQKITQEYTANDQSLTASKMTVVSDCMQGTTNLNVAGGHSLMCYKASTTTNKDGTASTSSTQTLQPCGAIDYLKSQIYQAEIKNSGNQRSNSVLQVASTSAASFDSLMRSMLRDLGANDPTDKTTGSKILNTRVSDWATLQSKYAANIKEIGDRAGINLSQQLAVVGQNCFNESNTWYTQQKSSAGSAYNQKVQAIDGEKNDLKSKMTNDITAMSGEFSSAVAVMGGVGNYTCADSSTIEKQQKCDTEVRTKLSDLLSGNGSAGTSTKTINGGSMVAGFNVSCRGINMCVNTYKAVRTQKKTQLTNAKNATTDFVTKANNMVQTQLQSFAQGLGELQKQVSSQFDNMQQMLSKLGVESTASAKYMKSEPLTPGGSKETGPGPFQNPQNMAAVLSGMVQPSGLMTLEDSGGVQELLKDAQKQIKKDAEKDAASIDKFDKATEKLADIYSSCTKGDTDAIAPPPGGDSNNVGAIVASNCFGDENDCQNNAAPLSGDDASNFMLVGQGLSKIKSGSDAGPLEKLLGALSQIKKAECEPMKTSCMKYVKGQKRGVAGSSPTAAGTAAGLATGAGD